MIKPLPGKKRRDLRPEFRYPNLVTIALGFNCSDALLLSADTEITTPGFSKLNSSKLFRKEYPNGINSAIAVAGSLAYGRMAMQHIEQILESIGKGKASVGRMRKEIEEEVLQLNNRYIYQHPDRADVSFHLLIALWSPQDARAALLWTQEAAVNELVGYAAIGAGDYLAHYLVRPVYNATMPEQAVRPLAIEAITKVNHFVPGCGGFIEVIKLGRNGTLGQVERLLI